MMSSMPEAIVQARIDGYVSFLHKPFQLADVAPLGATILGAPADPAR